MALSDLTSEAKDTATKLVEGWDQGKIDQLFWLVDITAGNARSVELAGGFGYGLEAWIPSLGSLHELKEQGLLDIVQDVPTDLRRRTWRVLLRQQLKDTVASNFAQRQRETVLAMKSRYRHLSEAVKAFATKLVEHYKSGMISRSFEFTVIMDRGSVASIKLANRDDSLDISPTEYRFMSDLESDGLVEVRRFRDYIEQVTLNKSLFDAVEANFEVTGNIDDEESSQKQPDYTRRVFVVHGHDEEIKQHTARILTQLGFEPVILHEQASRGMTIIEKLETYSDVGFAVVLLTPDDKGLSAHGSSEDAKYRARQNVVLELGYFLGKLGRNRVLALYRKHEDFELPSDYDGVIYEVYDVAGNWKYTLAKELHAAGYEVDLNVL